FILGDARPKLILSDSAHQPDLHNLLLVDADEPAPACVLPGVSALDPAYILYTSGTTGTPKGVCVPHLAVMNHAAHHVAMCGLGPKDKVLQFAATGFDTAVEEIIPTLMAGASLVSRPEGFLDTGGAFDALLGDNGITIADLPTQFWHQWVQNTTGLPPSLRLVVLGGEALTARQVSDWAARPDTAHVQLINTYGPTEAAIIVTAHEIDHAPALADPPLGRAIPGATLRLLDTRLAPVPIGIPGEIFLGGHCLAQGYLNRPDLTAERFVADPFGASDARLYRTGDLARLSADGTVSYLGRTDDQIKLRGFRIEPAEVEAALLDLGASAALVTLHSEAAGTQQLLAYVTGAKEAALLTALRQRLPAYMVPWRILELEQFPLTTNGKIDRRALPKPARAEVQAGPRDALTQEVAAIWGEVLSHAPDSMADDENFFALGGHSLLATQVISKIRTRFAIELPLRALFEHPTIGGLAGIVAANQAQTPAVTATIPALGPAGAHELSFAQQRLWFLDQLDPDSPHYTIPAALRLRGKLNRRALESAFTTVLTRHSVLRGRIRVQDHHPQMTVVPPAPFDLPLEDFSDLPVERALDAAVSRCAESALEHFDLTEGTLVRARLLRLSLTDHVLVLTMHHIVADGWSIGVLVSEIAALYAAFQRNQTDPLPPLSIQYSDFAAWQREWLIGAELQRQVDYWKDQLAEAPSLLALPTDRPRPAVQSHKGASLDFALSAELVDALRRVGRAKGATLFMVMQAALATLLHRLSGETDILIGTPIANRNRAELEPLIGFFVNTLVLRNHVSPDMRFADLLEQSHDTALAAYGHQDVPFEHLVEVLRPERHLSHSPLFQVMLALQNAPLGDIALEGLDIAPMDLPSVSAKFDLTVSLQEVAGGLDGNIEYATDLFDAATIERMATQFRYLLAAIAADLTVGISDLPLLTEADHDQILESFNQPNPALPTTGGQDVLSRIAGFATSAPGATALVLLDERLDYATLNAKANGLARVLAEHGVGPETVVGIAAERSFEMVIALLAVLKAGGGYLPLDPDYPDQRLTYMIEDAAPRLILASRSLAGKLRGFGPDVLALDLADIAGHSDAPNVAIHPQSCGYLIYTSGSTGRPKGVTLTRTGLENLIQWQLATGPVPDAVLQFASLNFDVSFQEIFSTLAAGKTLVLLPPGLNRDLEAVLNYSRQHKVGRMFLPNAVLQQMLALPRPAAAPMNRCEIISAGEALSTADHREALLHLLNGATLFNQYGPSETHVVTHEPLPASEAATWADRPPIGRPIWNARTYVLGSGLEPVPVGVWGQLYIGGVAPARGYHKRPDATAEKFLPDPFSALSGARMYATGDTARWLADGRLEFRGREDDQIKVNGIRVELGEIEAALKSLPDVQDATVILREDRPGVRQLVAYFVADTQSPDGLRRGLQSLLPGYMVPAFFIPLSSLPLTVNGKVDRRALPVAEVSV
ncbi:MAG: amino acid adenylation domain-containing protein, partial [Paracoccaceae bacterium]